MDEFSKASYDAKRRIETGVTILIAGIILASSVYFVFGQQMVKPSVDVQTLHLKHSYECRSPGVDPVYNIPTEPMFTVVNKLIPICIRTYESFSITLTSILLFLHVCLFLRIPSNVSRLLFAICSVFLVDLYTQTHLFRQSVATYLFAIWWLGGGRAHAVLPLAAFFVHNATILLLVGYFFARRLLLFARRHLLIALVGMTSLILFVFNEFAWLGSALQIRYGFAFFDRAFEVGDTYVVALYKYFIVAAVVGLLHYLGTRSTNLMKLGAFGLLVLTGGSKLGVDAELIFRILVPFRYVFLPLFLALALGGILQHLAQNGRYRTKFIVPSMR